MGSIENKLKYYCSYCKTGTNNKNDIHQYFKVYVVIRQIGLTVECKKCGIFLFLGRLE